jgi:hypothetical protein
MEQVKIVLDEAEIPTHWYNLAADMPRPPGPPLARDGAPIGRKRLSQIFPGPIIEQEISRARWIPIPDPVREIYRLAGYRALPKLVAALRADPFLAGYLNPGRRFDQPIAQECGSVAASNNWKICLPLLDAESAQRSADGTLD